MTSSRPTPTRVIGIVLIVVGLVAALGVVTLSWLIATYGGLDYKCIVEGPFRESAPFALVSEAVRVHGTFSWWPMGRACGWERADGLGFVTAGPGWGDTITLASCAGVALVGAGLVYLPTFTRPLKPSGTTTTLPSAASLPRVSK